MFILGLWLGNDKVLGVVSVEGELIVGFECFEFVIVFHEYK